MCAARSIGTMLMLLLTVSMSGMGSQSGTPGASDPDRIDLPGDAGEALYWPGGSRAVLLAHGAIYDAASWTPQAEAMQDAGYSVLAVENISAGAISTGIAWLAEDRGVTGVVVIGASAGGGGALRALSDQPAGVVGLILLGATGSVASLGEYPKLFTASEGEGMADQLDVMAGDAPGTANRVLLLPGSAHAQATFSEPEGEHLLDAMLRFLDEEAAWPGENGTPAA